MQDIINKTAHSFILAPLLGELSVVRLTKGFLACLFNALICQTHRCKHLPPLYLKGGFDLVRPKVFFGYDGDVL